MSKYVKRIAVTGLYGRFELQQQFYPGVNVLYGKNGCGKTTLLQILANALNGDYERFAYLSFDSIRIDLDDGTVLWLNQNKKFERHDRWHVLVNGKSLSKLEVLPQIQVEIVNEGVDHAAQPDMTGKVLQPLLPVAYFPAFRNVIDAWNLKRAENERNSYIHFSQNNALHFARSLFGKFVPKFDHTVPFEISANRHNGQGASPTLQAYLMTVNRFLGGKKLLYQAKQLKLKLANQEDYAKLDALSAGERHLISMLYAASQMSTDQLILIDEPEISLHLDWQEQLLTEMMAQQGSRQIIVCTHSPMIGAEHEDRMLEVKLTLAYKAAVPGPNPPRSKMEKVAA